MSVQYHRTPCPGRIFEDLGGGFLMGCGGGSIMYFFKGKPPLTPRSLQLSQRIKN